MSVVSLFDSLLDDAFAEDPQASVVLVVTDERGYRRVMKYTIAAQSFSAFKTLSPLLVQGYVVDGAPGTIWPTSCMPDWAADLY
jgi:hypothetical protein